MLLNQCINFLLNKTQNAVLIHFRSKLDEFNVTPAQYSILKCLWEQDNLSPKQLSQVLALDASTITGILDRLENKDLIRRVPSPADRRTLMIQLTDAGKALQTDIDRVIVEANHEVLADLTPEEQTALKGWLERICETCHSIREE